MFKLRQTFIIICLLISLFSCRTDSKQLSDLESVNIRLQRDPLRLNPIFNPSSTSREIFQYLYLPMADYHYKTTEFYPVLIKNIPKGRLVNEGPNKGQRAYDVEIKPDAVWYDGSPVTAHDYVFTVKSIILPNSNTVAWRSLISKIMSVDIDPKNPKKLSIYMPADFMLSKEVALSFELLPKHLHDPNGLLDQFTIEGIKENGDDIEATQQAVDFAEKFNSPVFSRDSINNSGPYKLNSWVTNQSIVLERKENYWGRNYPDNPFLQAGSKRLVFKIIPDENNALTALKNNELDVMTFRNSGNFSKLQSDPDYKDKYKFLSANQRSYYFISLNNKDPKLKDPKVRRALAHLVNVDLILDTIDHGFGQRTTGPFHPERTYYNEELKLIPFDINKAKEILDQSDWKDSNNNGTRDKVIDGVLTEMDLEFIISGSKLTENIGVLMKDAASKAGVNIELVIKKPSVLRKENIATRDFELFTYSINQDFNPDDPYSRFHSTSSADGGNNFFGYENSAADKLMSQIRDERDESKREELYDELQEIFYADQPLIFLYSPKYKIAINKDFAAAPSQKRPGYFANTFKSKVSTK